MDTSEKKLDFSGSTNDSNNFINSNNNGMLQGIGYVDSPSLPGMHPSNSHGGSNSVGSKSNSASLIVDDGVRDELQKARVLIREYENEIMRMRKKEAEYQRDSRVRVQLSRRLEQVLIDRQELKEKLQLYKSMRGGGGGGR